MGATSLFIGNPLRSSFTIPEATAIGGDHPFASIGMVFGINKWFPPIVRNKGVVELVFRQGPIKTLMEYLYTQIIEKAAQEKITSIAIPAVSTGINGFPLKKATRIALKTCISMLEQYPIKLTFANNEIKKHIGYQEIHSTLKLEIGGIWEII